MFLEAGAPRVRCREHGVVVAAVPWARHDSPFTAAYEDQVAWLAAHATATMVAELMRSSWRAVTAMVARVVAEARGRTDRLAGVVKVAIDEKAYRKGHRYLTVVTDLDTGREFTQPLDVDLPRAPEWSVNGMARYEWPTWFANTGFAGNFALHGDFNWRDDQNMLLSNASIGEQESYAIFNARASYTGADQRWEAAFLVENITDEFYCTQIFDVGADFNSRQCFFNRPRWYSVTLRFNF